MSSDTIITISLDNVCVDKDFFLKFEKTFNKYGFYLLLSEPLRVWRPEPIDEWIEVDWSEKLMKLEEHSALLMYYSVSNKYKYGLRIYLRYGKNMKIRDIDIESRIVKGHCKFYHEREIYLAKKLEFLSFDLHNIFDAINTEVYVENDYENGSWFHFTKDKSEFIKELVLAELHIPGDMVQMTKIAEDSNNPLLYDSENNEYQIVYESVNGKDKQSLLRNFLGFGGYLLIEVSQRDNNYYYPTEEEIERFKEVSWSSTSCEDVVEILGKPDFEIGSIEPIYEWELTITRQIGYTNISDTSVVIFREYEDGIVTVIYAGKEFEDNEDLGGSKRVASHFVFWCLDKIGLSKFTRYFTNK